MHSQNYAERMATAMDKIERSKKLLEQYGMAIPPEQKINDPELQRLFSTENTAEALSAVLLYLAEKEAPAKKKASKPVEE